MPLDSDMATLRRPYTRYARRLLNRGGMGALAGLAAGVVGAVLMIAGGLWLLAIAGWASPGEILREAASSATQEGAGRAATELASAATERSLALLAFVSLPFTLVGYGIVLGGLLGLAHGLVVPGKGRTGPIELVAAATGAAVAWQTAAPWLETVPPLAERARWAMAVAILAGGLGAAVGGALFAALRRRPRRADAIAED